ncbi:MAG: hypothetical protein UY05_C0023G0002 [Candidatus Peregrinibacteria bacterium GW2011_GWA2_47_7]|nr:MAG: hypothetical protein UY05_C0023G0002 [Candidatus Peregrinibacteria bacterium GW2011_GWA2_47_7]
MIGTILFWVTSLGIFELWINDQPESMERGRIEIDPVTGEKRIYIEEKTVYKEEIIPHPDSERYQESYLKSEQKFGKLKIGKPMPKGISMLDFESIPDSSFYVYVQRRGFSICEFDTCDIADAGVVQCMEGWLTGDEYPEAPHLLGLD